MCDRFAQYAPIDIVAEDKAALRELDSPLPRCGLPKHNSKRDHLMDVLDKANGKWGRGTLDIGSAGVRAPRAWTMQRTMLSPCYTTAWDQLREVR